MNFLANYNTPATVATSRKGATNELYYQHGWARVGYLTQPLSRACRLGDMSLAQRILQDIQWEWESQDKLAEISENENISRYHLGSECLSRLTLLITGKAFRVGTVQFHERIGREIKKINEQLDALFVVLGTMKKK